MTVKKKDARNSEWTKGMTRSRRLATVAILVLAHASMTVIVWASYFHTEMMVAAHQVKPDRAVWLSQTLKGVLLSPLLLPVLRSHGSLLDGPLLVLVLLLNSCIWIVPPYVIWRAFRHAR